MKPYYDDGRCVIYHGDCRDVLPGLTFDVMVTDPPYGIGWKRSANPARLSGAHDEPGSPRLRGGVVRSRFTPPINESPDEHDERVTGFRRPYGMDPDRHVAHGFDEPQRVSDRNVPARWKSPCDCEWFTAYGWTREQVEADELRHLRGEA